LPWLLKGMARTLVELLHIVAGVVATALIASLAVWAVPVAGRTIWWVAYFSMLAVAFMGIRPLRAAWKADRARRNGTTTDE
jgi:type IV secretory pathway TrbD component